VPKGLAVPLLLVELLRPHRRTIIAMLTALAVPWPLKSVLDNVVGNHPAPPWISWLLPALGGDTKAHIAEAAALLTVAIARDHRCSDVCPATNCGCGSITTCRNCRWPTTTGALMAGPCHVMKRFAESTRCTNCRTASPGSLQAALTQWRACETEAR
jgi:hypothetical protein